jgi:sigma-B regulation protein RsbU (phosphoserine phosphatase)
MPIELDDLKESSEFLNLLLDNIDAAVLVADENFQVHQFNRSFLDLFDRAGSPGEGSFGQIAGCVNAVRENGSCGKTSQCGQCVLHNSLMGTLLGAVPVNRRRLERIFYINGEPAA